MLQGGSAHDADEELLINKEKENKEVLGKSLLDCSSCPNNFFPNPLPTLSSPCKEVGLKGDVKAGVEGA